MNCSECQDLIAPFALDELSGATREQVRAHLSGCEPCGVEFHATQALLAQLPLTLAPVTPPASVKTRLMERVNASGAAKTSPSAGLAGTSAKVGWRWKEPLLAAAAAAVITTGIFAVEMEHQRKQLLALRDELVQHEARLNEFQASLQQEGNTIHLFVSPAVQLVALQGSGSQPEARARVFWDKSHGTFRFYAAGLKPLPGSQVFQLWYIASDQKKISAGTFEVNDRGEASFVPNPPGTAETPVAVAVTNEPAGGSDQPTGQILLLGNVR